jgi:hypothetical protein
VLVEGALDVVFYERLCLVAIPEHEFSIRQARELPSVTTGGKPGLLQFYDELRQRRALVTTLEGKTTVVIFVMDKDVDDVLRKRRRSTHVVYTESFEIENYLYEASDAVTPIAVVARVNAATVRRILPADWCAQAARAWQEWVVLCLLSQVLRVSCDANYSVRSQVNASVLGPVNPTAVRQRLRVLRTRADRPRQEFDALHQTLVRLVERRYATGRSGTIFRGKWYSCFVKEWIGSIAVRDWPDDELLSALLLALDFTAAWAEQLRAAVRGPVIAVWPEHLTVKAPERD